MKVLIIGGTGTIGLGIVKESIRRGYETYTISRGLHNDRIPKECIILKGDIKKPEQIKSLLCDKEFDVIFDGLVFRIPNLKSSLKMYSGKCKQYIFVSTTGIYQRSNPNHILNENAEQGRKAWEYNKGKIECEKYLKTHKDEFPFKYTVVRPSVTYGDRRIPFTIVNRDKQWSLVERIIDDKPIVAGPNVDYSICHLDDFSRAVVGLFLNDKAYGEAYHVGGPEVIRWDDTIYELAKYENKNPKIIHVNIELLKKYFPELYMEIKYNKSDPLLLDNKKIESTVEGFHPEISLSVGIERTYKVLKEEQKNLPYQKNWNTKIDALIFLSYKHNALSNDEMNIAKEYLEQIDTDELEEYIANAKKRYPIFAIKQKMKALAHNFI